MSQISTDDLEDATAPSMDSEESVPSSVSQYLGSIGFAAVVNFAVILLLIHVALRREWPPYKAALPGLVVYAGIAVSVGLHLPPDVQYEWCAFEGKHEDLRLLRCCSLILFLS